MIENVCKCDQTGKNAPFAELLTAVENVWYTPPHYRKKEWLKEPPFLRKEV